MVATTVLRSDLSALVIEISCSSIGLGEDACPAKYVSVECTVLAIGVTAPAGD
jgi:hypothetical protein